METSLLVDKYHNDEYGISVEFPADWSATEDYKQIDYQPNTRLTYIVTFTSQLESRNDPYYDSIYIAADTLMYKTDLEKYLQSTINDYETLPDFKLLSSDTSTILGNKPAYSLTYSYTYEDEEEAPGITVMVKEVGTIIGNKAYYVNFDAQSESYDLYLPLFVDLVDSFKFHTAGSHPETTTDDGGEFHTVPLDGIASESDEGLRTYVNLDYGITSMTVPKGWTISENETFVDFFPPYNADTEALPGLFTIESYESEGRGLNDFATEELKYLYSSSDTEVIESNPIKFKGDQPAHLIIYQVFDKELGVIKYLELLTVRDDIFYLMTYGSTPENYSTLLPSVLEMVKSLELVGDSGTYQVTTPETSAYLDPLSLWYKTSPCGGSCHPTEGCAVVLNMSDMRKGIYHFSIETNSLDYITALPNQSEIELIFESHLVHAKKLDSNL